MTRVVIGVPLYEQVEHLPRALESLLGQTFTDLRLVVVDDSASGAPERVVARYAAADQRIHYERNPERLGLARNWQRARERALELVPEAEFFAWGSDHDVWHPRWLDVLVAELDRTPGAVLAYPRRERVTGDGPQTKRGLSFATEGLPGPHRRLRQVTLRGTAGDMVYGLFRADALAAVGAFLPVLMPDRLLLEELSLRGTFVQVPETLWLRRMFDTAASPARQRAAFFPGAPPCWSYAPWWAQHAPILARRGHPVAAALVAVTGVQRDVQKAAMQRSRPLRIRVGRVRKRVRRGRRSARVLVGSARRRLGRSAP